MDVNAINADIRAMWVARLRKYLKPRGFTVEKMARHNSGAVVTHDDHDGVLFDLVYRNAFDMVTHVVLVPERDGLVSVHLPDLTALQATASLVEREARRALEYTCQDLELEERAVVWAPI